MDTKFLYVATKYSVYFNLDHVSFNHYSDYDENLLGETDLSLFFSTIHPKFTDHLINDNNIYKWQLLDIKLESIKNTGQNKKSL